MNLCFELAVLAEFAKMACSICFLMTFLFLCTRPLNHGRYMKRTYAKTKVSTFPRDPWFTELTDMLPEEEQFRPTDALDIRAIVACKSGFTSAEYVNFDKESRFLWELNLIVDLTHCQLNNYSGQVFWLLWLCFLGESNFCGALG